jgi:hypothetical protein
VHNQGFKEFIQTGITLQVGQNARVDVVPQVGAASQSVNVSAAALAVDTESTTVGEVIDNRRIESIPLNGRDVLDLMQLLPGVGTASNNNLFPERSHIHGFREPGKFEQRRSRRLDFCGRDRQRRSESSIVRLVAGVSDAN